MRFTGCLSRGLFLIVLILMGAATVLAQPPGGDLGDQAVRARYEEALARSPFQEGAFARVYESYLASEGIEAWVKRLEAEGQEAPAVSQVLLGRIRSRQFRTDEAIQHFEQARQLGGTWPDLDREFGVLYVEAGQPEKAVSLLSRYLDAETDPGKQADVVRILGSLYRRQGDQAKALETWKRLVEHNPADTFALLELADIYEENHMQEEAIGIFHRLIEVCSEKPYQQCRAWRSIGDLKLQMGQHAEAIASYEQALALAAPGNWLFEDVKDRLVSAYQDQGDLSGLAAYLEEKTAAMPQDIEFRALLAETYTRMDRNEEAEQLFLGILERAPEQLRIFEELIELYERTERMDQATATYERLIELFPYDLEYVHRLGEAHLRAGNPEQAKEVWQGILSSEPAAGEYAQLADWYQRAEFRDEAAEAYRKALALGPSKEWTFRLAGIEYERGNEEEALALCMSALEQGEHPAADYAEVAGIVESYGFREEAGNLFRQAVAQDPAAWEYRVRLADLLFQQEETEEALGHYEALAGQHENDYFRERGERGLLKAYLALDQLDQKKQEWEAEVAANPEQPGPMLRLAQLHRCAGNSPKAIELYEKASALEPGNLDTLRTLASAYEGMARHDQAIEVYQRLVELDPNRAGQYARDLRALYLRRDMLDEALATSEKLVEMHPGDAQARLDLAEVYWQAGKQNEALEQCRKVLRLKPDDPKYQEIFGGYLSRLERWDEAQLAYRSMIHSAKSDEMCLRGVQLLANTYLRLGRKDELVREFQAHLRGAPEKLAAYEQLAVVYKAAGEMDLAYKTMERSVDAVEDRETALRKLLSDAYAMNDFEKVVGCYERLIDLTGKAGAFELDRLATAYARLGRGIQACRTWNQIREEHPDDAGALKMAAKSLLESGFAEESIGFMRAALELDPYDYAGRFDLVQALANQNDIDEAIEQCRLILDLGEGPQAANAQGLGSANQPVSGPPIFSVLYGPGGWEGSFFPGAGARYGSFDQFKLQVIQTMLRMAQSVGTQDDVLADFEKQVEAMPENVAAARDLLTAYQALNRQEKVITLLESLVALQPDDPSLTQELAQAYSRGGQNEKKLALFEGFLQRNPQEKEGILYQLIPMYMDLERHEDAMALVKGLQEEKPDDAGTLMKAARLLCVMEDYDQAQSLLQRAVELDPQNADQYAAQIAQIHIERAQRRIQEGAGLEEVREFLTRAKEAKPEHAASYLHQLADPFRRQGNIEVAWLLWGEALLEFPPSSSPSRPAVPTVKPAEVLSNLSGRNWSSVHSYCYSLFPSIDQQKMSSLAGLMQMGADAEGSPALREKLNSFIHQHAESEKLEDRERARQIGEILFIFLASQGELEPAAETVAFLDTQFPGDAEVANARLLLLVQKGDWEGLLAACDELEPQFPAQAKDFAIARARVFLGMRDARRAAGQIRGLVAASPQPQGIVHLIRELSSQGGREEACSLLEQMLSGLNRNSEAMLALAGFYSEMGKHDQAIQLAREALENQAPRNYGRYWFPHYHYSRQRDDQVAGSLWGFYVRAGRQDELLREYEDRLAKQPASSSAMQALVTLYSSAGRRDAALDMQAALVAQQPNNIPGQLRYAELLQQANRDEEALKIYQGLLQSSTNLYQQVSSQLRHLCEKLGKTKELGQMEDDLARRASSQDDLRNLARAAEQRGEYDRAIEIYKRLLIQYPGENRYYGSISNVYAQIGKPEEALEYYQKYLEVMSAGRSSTLSVGSLARLVALHTAAERLGELKESTAAKLAEDSGNVDALLIQSQIAAHEGRHGDALALLQPAAQTANDMRIDQQLAAVAEAAGEFPVAIEALERMNSKGQQNDWNRLAELHVKNGDRAKALECWRKYAMAHGGPHIHAQVLEHLIRHEMWDEAEAYFQEQDRAVAMDQSASRNWRQIVLRAYMQHDRFKKSVEESIMPSLVREDLYATQSYSHENARAREKACEIYRSYLEKNPEDVEMVQQYAEVLRRSNLYDECEAVYRKLLALDPSNAQVLDQYGNLLRQLGKQDELIQVREKAFEAAPSLSSVRGLFSAYSDSKLAGKLPALRERALQRVPEGERLAVAALFADMDAESGNTDRALEALRAHFEAEKNAPTFQRFFAFLLDHGFEDEAYALLKEHLGSEMVEIQGRPSQFIGLLARRGDLAGVDALLAYELKKSETWRIQQALTGGMQAYRELGRQGEFIEKVEAAISEAQNPSANLLMGAAQAFVDSNDSCRALAIYDRLLATSPGNMEAARGKARALKALNRMEELEAFLAQMTEQFPPSSRNQHFYELQQLYVDAGVLPKMEKLIDELPLPEDPNGLRQRAEFYRSAQCYEKAINAFESCLNGAQPSDDVLRNIASAMADCYVHGGRYDEAMALWEKAKENQRFHGLARLLKNENQFARAARVLEAELEREPERTDLIRELGECWVKSGHPEACRALFAKSYTGLPKNRREEIRYFYGSLLQEPEFLDSVLAAGDVDNDPALQRGLGYALGSLKGKLEADKWSAVLALVDKVQFKDPADLISMAGAFHSEEDRDRGIDLLLRAARHPEITPEALEHAACTLMQFGCQTDEALQLYGRITETQPTLLLNRTELLGYLARLEDKAAVRSIVAHVERAEADPWEIKMVLAIFDSLVDKEDPAPLDRLEELADDPAAVVKSLPKLATALAGRGRQEAVLRLYERIIAEPAFARDRAVYLDACMRTAKEAGDRPLQWRYYARLIPENYQRAAGSWKDLVADVKPEELEDIEAALEGVVREHPSDDRVSVLLGLFSQLSSSLGREQAAGALAEAWGAGAREREESAIWDRMIEKWHITEPQPLGEDNQMLEPLYSDLLALAKGESALEAVPGTWTAVDPAAALGFLDLVAVLAPEDGGNLSRHAAHLFAEVSSPDERTVRFTCGSPGWIRIWVNAEEVCGGMPRGYGWPGELSFEAHLRAGKNTVVVRTFNNSGQWAFGLAPTTNYEGLEVVAP